MHRPTAATASLMPTSSPAIQNNVTAFPLPMECQNEVLDFLAARPLHTVGMVGLIRDNGLVSELNRGTFYGCRNRRGEIEGVALIGHSTLMETRTDRALQAFAELARNCSNKHLIMGEQERLQEFWAYYCTGSQQMRHACRELLYQLSWPVQACKEISGLRLAQPGDIELVMPLHAELALAESGINPLEIDPLGFRARCARRIEQGRTWVWIEDNELIFKADVISETSYVTYLEGISVSKAHRSKGYGLKCLSQLARALLLKTKSICLLVNQENTPAQALYEKSGFKLRGQYDTVFM